MADQDKTKGKDLALKEDSPIAKLKSVLNADSVREQFQNTLKENSGSFIASVIDLVGSEKALQECNPNAICMEALKAATLQLPINKQLGFAYIVGFKKVATFIIGYRGLVQLALRTGQYKHLNCGLIFDGEQINEDRLTGSITISGSIKSNKVIGYFAHMELKSGFTKTLAMTKEQIITFAKAKSPSYSFERSAWTTDFDAMAKKTVLRSLLTKWGIMTTEMQKAMSFDDEADADSVKAEIKRKANKGTIIDAKAETVPDPQPGAAAPCVCEAMIKDGISEWTCSVHGNQKIESHKRKPGF